MGKCSRKQNENYADDSIAFEMFHGSHLMHTICGLAVLYVNLFLSLEAENCREMFCSWEGIMLGEAGQVWIAEVSQELKITGINGMLIK